jgi:hypothetical protein
MATDEATLMASIRALPAEALVGAGEILRKNYGPRVEVAKHSLPLLPEKQDESGFLTASAFVQGDNAYFSLFDGSLIGCTPTPGHLSEELVRKIRGKESVTTVAEKAIDLGNLLLGDITHKETRESAGRALSFLYKYFPQKGERSLLWNSDFLNEIQGKGIPCSRMDIENMFTLFLHAADAYVFKSGYDAAHACLVKAGSIDGEIVLPNETYRRGMQGMVGVVRGRNVICSSVGMGYVVNVTNLYDGMGSTALANKVGETNGMASAYLGQNDETHLEGIDASLKPGEVLMAANGAALSALVKTNDYNLLHEVFHNKGDLARQDLDVIAAKTGIAMERYLPQIGGGSPAFVLMRGQ